ncbi:hypothetical protein ADUPG1_006402 [Aduncisulcus paluster]|uniref:Uncharacterized protein n=1 Tax=Aduncisulcus paluster TaxID=2918883 RepID=A0ABQ5KMP4_9EUKA|nr:hypothetical protein ADUPG1_006402 [Aduncisulcus paluster]
MIGKDDSNPPQRSKQSMIHVNLNRFGVSVVVVPCSSPLLPKTKHSDEHEKIVREQSEYSSPRGVYKGFKMAYIVYCCSGSSVYSFPLPSHDTLLSLFPPSSSPQSVGSSLSKLSIQCSSWNFFEKPVVKPCSLPDCIIIEGIISDPSDKYLECVKRSFDVFLLEVQGKTRERKEEKGDELSRDDDCESSVSIYSEYFDVISEDFDVSKYLSDCMKLPIPHIIDISNTFIDSSGAFSSIDLADISVSPLVFLKNNHITNFILNDIVEKDPKTIGKSAKKEFKEYQQPTLCFVLSDRAQSKSYALKCPNIYSLLTNFSIPLGSCINMALVEALTSMKEWIPPVPWAFTQFSESDMEKIKSMNYRIPGMNSPYKLAYSPEYYQISIGIVKNESDKEPKFRTRQEIEIDSKIQQQTKTIGTNPDIFKEEEEEEVEEISPDTIIQPLSLSDKHHSQRLIIDSKSAIMGSGTLGHVPFDLRSPDFIEISLSELGDFIGAPIVSEIPVGGAMRAWFMLGYQNGRRDGTVTCGEVSDRMYGTSCLGGKWAGIPCITSEAIEKYARGDKLNESMDISFHWRDDLRPDIISIGSSRSDVKVSTVEEEEEEEEEETGKI